MSNGVAFLCVTWTICLHTRLSMNTIYVHCLYSIQNTAILNLGMPVYVINKTR